MNVETYKYQVAHVTLLGERRWDSLAKKFIYSLALYIQCQ